MDDATDNCLIAAYHQGDAAALRILVDRHLSAVSAFCYQLVLNRTQAEDLAQETFLKAIRSLTSYRGTAQFKTWLFAIAANLAKTSRALQWRETTAAIEFDQLATSVEQAPEQTALQNELATEIEAAMHELPLPLRAAIVLLVVHGTSPQEIAEIEGCPLNTIYWRIHEARKLLKRRLQQWTT
jgi:RNA polymerase sigma-70 factor (ECF subfamily)